MVRSFLVLFARIDTEPRVGLDGEVQKRQDALLPTGEGREMRPPAAFFLDDR